MTALKKAVRFTLFLVMLLAAGWGVLALYYFDHETAHVRSALAAAFAVVSAFLITGFALPRWRWRAFSAFLILFALLLWQWLALEPSNDREWQSDVAVLPYATIDGDRVTVHNIRNFD